LAPVYEELEKELKKSDLCALIIENFKRHIFIFEILPLRRESEMVDEKELLGAIEKAREGQKRKFTQTVELVINLKDVDVKQEENKIEELVKLPNGRGKKAKVCALVGPELFEPAKAVCDLVILADNFQKVSEREIKTLAKKYDFFIAQANIMPLVAKVFGRALSPRSKMPSPKLGLIVPPKANIKPLVEDLKQSVKLICKKAPVIQTLVGIETMKNEDLAKNILAILDKVKSKLPNKEHNIKNILVKLTMGKPVSVKP